MNPPSEKKVVMKHSIEHLTSPSSDEETNSIDEGRSTSSCQKKNSEKIVSYTEMIATAIFAGVNNMSTLQEIYNFLIMKYPVLKNRGKSWKNSVRHTLSLNEWFIKIPRTDNGKCCYWSIHPVYLQRFRKGDFQKQRKAGISKLHKGRRVYNLPLYDIIPPGHHTNGYYPQDIPNICHPAFSPWPAYRTIEGLPSQCHSAAPYSPYHSSYAQPNYMPPSYFVNSPPATGETNEIKLEKMDPSERPSYNHSDYLPYNSKLSPPDLQHSYMHHQKRYLDSVRFGAPLPTSLASTPPSFNGSFSYSSELQRQFQMRSEHVTSQM